MIYDRGVALFDSVVVFQVHEGIYYWKVGNSMGYQAALTTPGTPIHYQPERQGEAVCWEPSGAGFYTMSEGRNQPIYYYARA